MRGIDRWKVSDVLKRTFSGFRALEQETQAGKDIWTILGFEDGKPTSIEHVKEAYRARAKIKHPDALGGSHEAFTELNNAYQSALKLFGQS